MNALSEKKQQTIQLILTVLVLFDLALVVWVVWFPDGWFWAFHGSAKMSPDGLLMLRRCGANWSAFLLFQFVAWRHWRKQPIWLAIVAGIRWSDIFTDPSVALLSQQSTWFLYATLPAMGLINLWLGLFFFRAFQESSQFER